MNDYNIEQDRFDRAGNMTNPLDSYAYLQGKGADYDKIQDVTKHPNYGAVLHGHDVQLGQEASSLEEVSSEKALTSSSTPDVAKSEVRGKGRSY